MPEVPASHTYRTPAAGDKPDVDEIVIFPLLSTNDLLPVYSRLKAARLQAIKDSLKDVEGITPREAFDLLRNERQFTYNPNLVLNYALTIEGLDEILAMSLKKITPALTTSEIARILNLPISIAEKEDLVTSIINPGKQPDPAPPLTGNKPPAISGAFGDSLEEALAGAAQNASKVP